MAGYDRIALAVIRAIHHDSGAIIPVNVANESTLPGLKSDDVIEVPSVVDSRGARPLPVEPIPNSVCSLIMQVKEYERLAVESAITRSMDAATRALHLNPLVGDLRIARQLLERLTLQ